MNINPALRQPYLIENVFTPEECKRIIELGLTYIPVHDVAPEELKRTPQGKRRVLHKEADYQWLIQRMMPMAAHLNQQNYKFQVSGVEIPHFCEYNVGESSPWHHDFASDTNTNRKLTLLVFLSNPDDFKGGQFHIFPSTERTVQKQGNMLMFPAYLMHQVEPVISGVRYSLITWGIGQPFT